MADEIFTYRTRIDAPAERVFDWHKHDDAFDRLTPPWANVQSLFHEGGIQDGARREVQVRLGPLRRRWLLEHRDYIEGRQFRDVQVRGPFAKWEHTHRIEPDGDQACFLEDRIEYRLPGGILGKWLGKSFVGSQLRRLFEYRHRVTAEGVEGGGTEDEAHNTVDRSAKKKADD